MTSFTQLLASMVLIAGVSAPATAQDTAQDHVTPTPALSVELNAVEPQQGACRLVFVVENNLGADLSSLVLEAVVFDTAGKVKLLTLFDFRDVPDARPRVRQFDLAGADCTALGRVLLNDVQACVGTGIAAAACKAGLRWSSCTEIEVLG